MRTVVETLHFQARAKKAMSDEEKAEAITMIAFDPQCGVLIKGTGGIRKVRFGIEERGKRGGVHIIYFFHSDALPIFLLEVFAKNEKADLSAAERNALVKLAKVLKDTCGARS